MALVVQKFGGTSLEGLPRIMKAAETVLRELEQGNQVVVVVSAMAGVTNQLVDWVRGLDGHSDNPEYDMVASTGEQVTAGLLALALQKKGVRSRSWTGPQIPIHTDTHHGEAEILQISCEGLLHFLAQGGVSVVTGFQGVNAEGRLTTLGRGGSDTTAVALAAFLQADRCDIYTDVEGVYTADPRVVEEAQKISALSYDEMLALSDHGAKVLHPRAVQQAQKNSVPVRVLSSFTFKPGTLISCQSSGPQPLFGLTYTLDWMLAESNDSLLSLGGFERQEIIYVPFQSPVYRVVFSRKIFEQRRAELLTGMRILNDNLASISLINGALDKTDMKNLRMRFLTALSEPGLPQIHMQATSPLQWQVWVCQEDLPAALRLLHRRLQAS